MKLKAWLDQKGAGAANALAARVGVTSEAVRLWATGQRMPRPKVMIALRKATSGQVTYSDFYEAA